MNTYSQTPLAKQLEIGRLRQQLEERTKMKGKTMFRSQPGTQPASRPASSPAQTEWESLIQTELGAGKSRMAATKIVAKRHPDLRERLVREANS